MTRRSLPIVAGLLCVALVSACGGHGPRHHYRDVRIPPKVDLTQHDVIAVLEFQSSNEGELASFTTRRFTDVARQDQGLVRMMQVVAETARRDAASVREIGREHGAQTVLVGTIEISDVRPKFSLGQTLKSGSMTANVDATLTVDLVETSTGASIWSASSRATRTIGHVSVFDDRSFTFDAEDPEEAYGPLIDALVGAVTSDFRSTWTREKVYVE